MYRRILAADTKSSAAKLGLARVVMQQGYRKRFALSTSSKGSRLERQPTAEY